MDGRKTLNLVCLICKCDQPRKTVHPCTLAIKSNFNLIPSNHLFTVYFKGHFVSKAFLVSIQIFSSGHL